MAAPSGATQSSGSDSSGSENEDLERFREATWKPPVQRIEKPVKCQQDPIPSAIPSLRTQPDCHEHDGNELQTTPEFRTHVAKKLAAILDSCIKEIPRNGNLKTESKEASNSEDEGFRLFRTSVPGDSGIVASNSVPKRKVASSTSEDSEEEKQRRFCEAAVSGLDILKQSALQPTLLKSLDTVCNNQPTKKKCKKKKKKEDRALGIEVESDDQNTTESQKNVAKLKKKKVALENTDKLKDR